MGAHPWGDHGGARIREVLMKWLGVNLNEVKSSP